MPLVEIQEKEEKDNQMRLMNYVGYEEHDSMDEYIGMSYASSDELSVVSEVTGS
jgi:hypothetical protein